MLPCIVIAKSFPTYIAPEQRFFALLDFTVERDKVQSLSNATYIGEK